MPPLWAAAQPTQLSSSRNTFSRALHGMTLHANPRQRVLTTTQRPRHNMIHRNRRPTPTHITSRTLTQHPAASPIPTRRHPRAITPPSHDDPDADATNPWHQERQATPQPPQPNRRPNRSAHQPSVPTILLIVLTQLPPRSLNPTHDHRDQKPQPQPLKPVRSHPITSTTKSRPKRLLAAKATATPGAETHPTPRRPRRASETCRSRA